jgi:hypothetical protein
VLVVVVVVVVMVAVTVCGPAVLHQQASFTVQLINTSQQPDSCVLRPGLQLHLLHQHQLLLLLLLLAVLMRP